MTRSAARPPGVARGVGSAHLLCVLVMSSIAVTAPFMTIPMPDKGVFAGNMRQRLAVESCSLIRQVVQRSRMPAVLCMQDASDEVRERLENAYRSSLGSSEPEPRAVFGVADEASRAMDLLGQLPIWTSTRMQAAESDRDGRDVMLPGLQTLLSVQDPRHLQMFERLLAGSGPYLFGAVMLEDRQEEQVFAILAQ